VRVVTPMLLSLKLKGGSQWLLETNLTAPYSEYSCYSLMKKSMGSLRMSLSCRTIVGHYSMSP
jgi:hypothetical protein